MSRLGLSTFSIALHAECPTGILLRYVSMHWCRHTPAWIKLAVKFYSNFSYDLFQVTGVQEFRWISANVVIPAKITIKHISFIAEFCYNHDSENKCINKLQLRRKILHSERLIMLGKWTFGRGVTVNRSSTFGSGVRTAEMIRSSQFHNGAITVR